MFSLAVEGTVKGHVGMAALSIMGKQGEEAGQKQNRSQEKQGGRALEKLIECFWLLPLFQLL